MNGTPNRAILIFSASGGCGCSDVGLSFFATGSGGVQAAAELHGSSAGRGSDGTRAMEGKVGTTDALLHDIPVGIGGGIIGLCADDQVDCNGGGGGG